MSLRLPGDPKPSDGVTSPDVYVHHDSHDRFFGSVAAIPPGVAIEAGGLKGSGLSFLGGSVVRSDAIVEITPILVKPRQETDEVRDRGPFVLENLAKRRLGAGGSDFGLDLDDEALDAAGLARFPSLLFMPAGSLLGARVRDAWMISHMDDPLDEQIRLGDGVTVRTLYGMIDRSIAVSDEKILEPGVNRPNYAHILTLHNDETDDSAAYVSERDGTYLAPISEPKRPGSFRCATVILGPRPVVGNDGTNYDAVGITITGPPPESSGLVAGLWVRTQGPITSAQAEYQLVDGDDSRRLATDNTRQIPGTT